MIITPDCDQFNTVIVFSLGTKVRMANLIKLPDFDFVPLELFNMIWLRAICLSQYKKKNVTNINLVPITIRKNLINIDYKYMFEFNNHEYVEMIAKYINGDVFRYIY